MKKSKVYLILFPVSVLIGSIIITYITLIIMLKLSVLQSMLNILPKSPLKGINIIAMGIDETKDTKRSDTIIVLHLDKDKNRIGALSIPRDTRLKVEGFGLTKVNHAYAHGGTTLLKQTVSNFLNLPIDNYIRVNVHSVKKLVDIIGGVTLTIKKDLKYVDNAGGVNIDLKKGRQLLNGDKAIQYLRFRYDNQGDIGRINRQQVFLKAIIHKVFGSQNILKLPQIIKVMSESIKTDLSLAQLVSLGMQFTESFQMNNVHMTTVPGAMALINRVSYWKPDIITLDKLIEKKLLGFTEETKAIAMIEKEEETVEKMIQKKENQATQKIKLKIKKEKDKQRRLLTIKEVSRLTEQTDILSEKIETLKGKLVVEVLNGYGKSGAAREGARLIKQLGLKVARFGDSGHYNYEKTVIVDWRGNIDDIIVLSQALKIDPSRIIVYDKPNKVLDVTLVLGKDWDYIRSKL